MGFAAASAVTNDLVMYHEDYKELLALEAVGALSPEEADALTGHLATCDECTSEVEILRETSAALVFVVEPIAPPADLRERVLARVRAGDRTAENMEGIKRAAGFANANGVGKQAASATTGGSQKVVQIGAWRLLTSRPVLRYGALAAAIVIALLAFTSVLLWSRNRELTGELARLSQNLNRAQGDLLLAREESARALEIRDIVTAPGAPIAVLAGTEVAPRASGRIVVDRLSGNAVLAAEGLPPAPAGKAYQLWYIANGKPQPGGVFTADTTGRIVLTERVPEAGRDATIFAVTLEPEGGVQSPTGSMYLKGTS